jgi:hypothetical protein
VLAVSFFRPGVERKGGIFMSRTYHHGKDRRIRVRGERRPTDLKRLARALIEMEYQQAQTEAEAQAEAKANKQSNNKQHKGKESDADSGAGA